MTKAAKPRGHQGYAVGTQVRYSDRALAGKRNRWLDASPSQKAVYEVGYRALQAQRGVITEVLVGAWGVSGYAVRWENGSESRTISYFLTPATPKEA